MLKAEQRCCTTSRRQARGRMPKTEAGIKVRFAIWAWHCHHQHPHPTIAPADVVGGGRCRHHCALADAGYEPLGGVWRHWRHFRMARRYQGMARLLRLHDAQCYRVWARASCVFPFLVASRVRRRLMPRRGWTLSPDGWVQTIRGPRSQVRIHSGCVRERSRSPRHCRVEHHKVDGAGRKCNDEISRQRFQKWQF